MGFPQDFVWGAATASYQIEGAALEDGRGECIWTRFSHTPGNIVDEDTGDVACDHYHRYPEDVRLMQTLGLDAYRFSVSWPRVIPQGTGSTNPAGLAFYDRLVDTLLEANVTPFVTLYHWDLPQALQERGGWENPDIVNWFADYTDLMARHLGDRVKHWMTLNEPFVVSWLGYFLGVHAPGIQNIPSALKAAHHLLLAHAAGVQVLRENAADARVGVAMNYSHAESVSDRPEDMDATRYYDAYHNRWFLDPVFKGAYPEDGLRFLALGMDGIDLDEIKQVNEPLDFLGLNYYTRTMIAAEDAGGLAPFKLVLPEEKGEFTEMDWEVYPEGLRQMLLRVHQDYAPPAIYITEIGSAFSDPEPVNGVIEDARRVAFYKSHLEACEAALAAGVPVKGYFAWTLIDNFEWAYGYSKRFGLVHVDFETQQRTLKQSADYYRRVIAANAVVAS